MKKLKCFLGRVGSIVALLAVFSVFLSLGLGKTDGHIRSRVVKLLGNGAQCSGEQVRAPSGEDYILTAAHCLPLAVDGVIQVTTEDGRVLPRRIISEDMRSDLLLLEGLPHTEGLEIASYARRFQRVRTFTHGKGHDTYQSQGVLIDDRPIQIPLFAVTDDASRALCQRAPKYRVFDALIAELCILEITETSTDAFIVPGSSGGAVVDSSGDLVGVVSAGGDGFGYLVRLEDIQKFISNF